MSDKKLNLKEIVEMAIQIEKAGAAFYKRLVDMADSEETRELFRHLEKAEYQHIMDFEAVLQEALARPDQLQYSTTETDLLYLRAVASRRIFTSAEDAITKTGQLRDMVEAIDMALDFELGSVGFYREMAEMIENPMDRASVEELQRQEKGHAAELYRMREKITGSDQ